MNLLRVVSGERMFGTYLPPLKRVQSQNHRKYLVQDGPISFLLVIETYSCMNKRTADILFGGVQ